MKACHHFPLDEDKALGLVFQDVRGSSLFHVAKAIFTSTVLNGIPKSSEPKVRR